MIKEEVKEVRNEVEDNNEVRTNKEKNNDQVKRKKKKKPSKRMKWTIRCVKSNNWYFTEGKTYPAYEITHRKGKAYIKVMNDNNKPIFLALGGNNFGKFELVI